MITKILYLSNAKKNYYYNKYYCMKKNLQNLFLCVILACKPSKFVSMLKLLKNVEIKYVKLMEYKFVY